MIQQQITTFDDDKAAILEHFPSENVLSGPQHEQHTDAIQHSIVSFLERPMLLAKVDWTPSITRSGAPLWDKYVPDVLLYDKSRTMFSDKLDGFTSFRATAVIRVQVNAQPFQAGRLILCAIPMPTLINPRDDYIKERVSLMQAVNSIQLDISKQTEVSLRIPFISPFNSYDLIHKQFPWARVILKVYGPLNEVEQSNLQVIIWGHFEEIELGAPTSAAMQQSGVVPPRPDGSQVSLLRSLENGIGSILDVLKSGSSGVLGGLQTAYSSGRDTLSGVSSMLGFSKPQLQETGCPVYIRPTTFFQNVDGQDTSHVLALTKANNITSMQGLGGTTMDETSFEYVKRIPQFIGAFSYTSTTGYDTRLWQCLVAPTFYLPESVVVTAPTTSTHLQSSMFTANQPTVLNYVTSSFMYWTGTLVFTFKFVKTDYHSGRVEVSFHPFTSDVDANRMDYIYRCVIDLREKTEASFSVPFISPQPWKVVQQIDPVSDVGKDWNSIGPGVTGVVYVRALTPLIQASTIVSNCVECLVETRAGDDFRVQGPCKSWFSPVTVARDTAAVQQSGPDFAIPGTQETRTSSLEGFTPLSITNNESDTHQVDTSMDCAGEIFGSFRALTRRFAFTAVWNWNKGDPPILDLRPATYIRPPTIRYCNRINRDTTPETTAVQFAVSNTATPLSFVASMYTFYRGGIRFKVVTNKDPILLAGRLVYDTEGLGTRRTKQKFYPFMAPAAYEQYQQKRIAEYQVPFYSPTMLAVHWDADRISQFDQPSTLLQLSSTASEDSRKLNIAIAAGDDFDLYGFLGVPLVLGQDVLAGSWEIPPGTVPAGQYDRFKLSLTDVDPTYPLDSYPEFGQISGQFVDLKIDAVKFTSVKIICPIPKRAVKEIRAHSRLDSFNQV